MSKNEHIITDYVHKLIKTLEGSNSTIGLPIPIDSIDWILRQVRTLFLKEPMMIAAEAPMKIVGDIHGQYKDLLNIFKRLGKPSVSNRYMFLGDYVDRGSQSLETILLLFCYKIIYRGNIILLRGNHECSDVCRDYGFFDECKRRDSTKLWRRFIDVFDTMSIAATIGVTKNDPLAFCVHGGISGDLKNLNQINQITKPTDIPDNGILCDLLWSDPSQEIDYFLDSERGVSYEFGQKALNQFLKRIGVDIVIRAHQVVEDGYEFFGNRKLVTVFSAPRYGGEFDNAAAVMIINESFRCSFEIFT